MISLCSCVLFARWLQQNLTLADGRLRGFAFRNIFRDPNAAVHLVFRVTQCSGAQVYRKPASVLTDEVHSARSAKPHVPD